MTECAEERGEEGERVRRNIKSQSGYVSEENLHAFDAKRSRLGSRNEERTCRTTSGCCFRRYCCNMFYCCCTLYIDMTDIHSLRCKSPPVMPLLTSTSRQHFSLESWTQKEVHVQVECKDHPHKVCCCTSAGCTAVAPASCLCLWRVSNNTFLPVLIQEKESKKRVDG